MVKSWRFLALLWPSIPTGSRSSLFQTPAATTTVPAEISVPSPRRAPVASHSCQTKGSPSIPVLSFAEITRFLASALNMTCPPRPTNWSL